MGFREHGVMLFLDADLYTAFIQLQADKGLGRSYAGLLPFVEGLYTLGYLDKEVYIEHRVKYSEKLVKKTVPKAPICSFCDRPSVSRYQDKKSGIHKFVCEIHAEQLADHPKWQIVDVQEGP